MKILIYKLCSDMKQAVEETGNISTTTKNVVEKGEVEATKEEVSEKEKEKEKKNEKSEKEVDDDKDKDAANEQEVVFIQDMGFIVKIVSPNAEPFDIQVSSMELVQVTNNFLNNSFYIYIIIEKNIFFSEYIFTHIHIHIYLFILS